MTDSRARKTIRKNPLDALGAEPLNRSKAAKRTPKADKQAEHQEDAELAQPSEQAPQPSPSQAQAPKKNVEQLFEAELGGSHASHAKKSAAPQPVDPAQVVDHHAVDAKALAIVKTWSQWAALGGTIPAPFIDVALVSGAQVKMLHVLCKHYKIPFEKKLTFTLITALMGGTMPAWLAQMMTRAALKSVPVVGSVMSLTAEPAMAFAATYAIGRTFIQHFESKGTLVSFSAEKMSEAFHRFLQTGQAMFKKSVP